MRGGFLVCAVAGHGWSQPPDLHEANPVFVCRRCGRRQDFSARSGGYGSRLDARTGADRTIGPFGGRR